MLNIVMIGHGAIASYVASQIDPLDNVRIAAILCRPGREQSARQSISGDAIATNQITDVSSSIDLAIDCAGHQGLRQHGVAILERGIDLMTISVGALADDGLAEKLDEACTRGRSRLHLLSGAIGGIDALTAARTAGLDQVVYRGRKPPAGWKGSPAEQIVDLDTLTEATCHFSGSARDAARHYPKNANVAATVALAGLGLDETRVELIADPNVARNIHEVEAEGKFGQFHLTLSGNPLPDNPKSSALAAMSMVQAIHKRLQNRTIG